MHKLNPDELFSKCDTKNKILFNHYLIDYRITPFGVFRLWESKIYGDEARSKVTLNGYVIGETWDDLNTFIKEYISEV